MNIVTIDLHSCKTSREVLTRIGKTLEFGGTGGNSWGENWDACADSLCYLDKGGIYGTSKIIQFPVHLKFVNSKEFRVTEPNRFETLIEIMNQTREVYSKKKMSFSYAI